MDEEREEQKKRRVKKPPLLEWAAAAVGLLLVVGSIGFVLYKAAAETGIPPILTVTADSVTPVENGWLVKFTLENKGEKNAADVAVEGKIRQEGAEDPETSTITIDYAPANSKREGGLFFSVNPAEHKLELRALGYREP